MVHLHCFRYNTVHYGTVSDVTWFIIAVSDTTQFIIAQFDINIYNSFDYSTGSDMKQLNKAPIEI